MATARQGVPLGVWLVYLNVVLYALCYQLQMPIEPFLVSSAFMNKFLDVTT